jgi:hypothetical protein
LPVRLRDRATVRDDRRRDQLVDREPRLVVREAFRRALLQRVELAAVRVARLLARLALAAARRREDGRHHDRDPHVPDVRTPRGSAW